MPLQFERIRNPDGIEDSTVISFDNKPHFIASLGNQIQIFDLQKLVFSFTTKFYIQKIIAFQKYYFLLGNHSYSLYKDRALITDVDFPISITKIYKILISKNSFLMIYDKRKFLTGTINNYKLEIDKSITDNHFFNALSAAVLNDKINVLVSNFTKLFLISFTVEGLSCLKSTRREIQNGSVLVSRQEDFLLFDEQGMWQCGAKSTFIKEFANYKIKCSTKDDLRIILFCENGEVIVINKDNSHYSAGTLDCCICSASMIGDMIFCTSRQFSYFIKITDKIEIIEQFGSSKGDCTLLSVNMDSIGDVSPLLITSKKTQTVVEYKIKGSESEYKEFTGIENTRNSISNMDQGIYDITRVSNTFRMATSEINKIIKNPAFARYNFSGCLACGSELIINFDLFSIFRGILMKPILSASSYRSTFSPCSIFISTSDSLLCISNSEFKSFKMPSEITKFAKNFGIFYYENKITVFNLSSLGVASINVTFDLCDFTINENSLFCIDLNENLHAFSILTLVFKPVNFEIVDLANNFLGDSSITDDILMKCKNSQSFANDNLADNQEVSSFTDSFLSVNGKIFSINNNSLSLLLKLDSFINSITYFNNCLVISACKTFIFNFQSKELIRASDNTINSFVLKDSLFVTAKNGIKQFYSFNPEFTFESRNFKIKNSQKLIASFSKKPVVGEATTDQKSFKLSHRNSSIVFENSFNTCNAQIRKDLICLGFANLENIGHIKGKISIVLISKKNLKIRKEIDLEDFPMAICSYKNSICVVLTSLILLYQLDFGKLILKKKIFKSGITRSAQFINKHEIIIRNEDWSFSTVNLHSELINNFPTGGTVIPFTIDKQNGFGMGSKLHISGCIMDCNEEITQIKILGKFVLIFCVNGSVFLLKMNKDTDLKSIYNDKPSVVDMSQ